MRYTHAVEVTPSDAKDLFADALYIGEGGDVAVELHGGSEVVFANVPSGKVLEIAVAKVLSTGTTASDIIALV